MNVKYLKTLLWVLGLSLSISPLFAQKNNTKISCKIKNVEYFSVFFSGIQDVIKETEWEKEVKIDSTGIASYELFIHEPAIVRISYDFRYFEAYLEPGDSLHLAFDGQIYPSEIAFSGTNAMQNEYLHAFRDHFVMNSRRSVIKQMCQSPPLEFRNHIDGITNTKWNFYQKYDAKKKAQFKPAFARFAESEIAYWRSYFLMYYYDEHLSILSGEKYYIPDAYFDFLDDTRVNNDDAFLQPFYRKFLTLYHGFRANNLDFTHGLASRQQTVIAQNDNIHLFEAVDATHVMDSLAKGEKVLLVDKLTFPASEDGIPVAYRLLIKRNNGQKGWIKSAGITIDKTQEINTNPLYINTVEVNTHRDLIKGMVKFDTLKIYADQNDEQRNYITQIKSQEKLVLLNSMTTTNQDYNDQKIIYAAPFTKIRSNRGIMGWLSTSGIQMQWKKTVLTEIAAKADQKSESVLNNLDYFFTGKALHYLTALDIRERLAFEGKTAVKTQYEAFVKMVNDSTSLANLKAIYQNEDKRFYVDTQNVKIDRRLVSNRPASLNTPPSPFRLAHVEDQYAASAIEYKKNKALNLNVPTLPTKDLKAIQFPEVTYNILPAKITGKNRINRNFELQLLVFPDLININSRTIPIKTVKGENFFKGKNFIFEVPLIEPIFGMLISDKDSIPIYLQPGDEIELLSGKLGEAEVECRGKSASNLKYLQYVKKNLAKWDAQSASSQHLSAVDFRKFIDQLYAEKIKFLNTFPECNAMTPQFLRLIEIDIDYWHGYQLMNYAQKHATASFPKDYYDFFDNLVVQNDFALPSEYYRKFVSIYLEEKIKKDKKESLSSDDLARTSFGEKTLKYLQAIMLSQDLEVGIDNKKVEITQNFVQDNAYTILNEMLKTSYKKRLVQEKNAIAPNFSLLKSKGKTVSLNDFKGKTIYMEFWDSKCTQWIKDAKQLKKRHKEFKGKDVVFLYVNLDNSQQAWKKILRKRRPKGIHCFQSDLDLYNTRIDVAYNIGTNLPAAVLIDKNGKIVVSPSQKADVVSVLNKARVVINN